MSPETVVNAPVAASNWYPTLTCGSSKLGSFQRPHPGQPHKHNSSSSSSSSSYAVSGMSVSDRSAVTRADHGHCLPVAGFWWQRNSATGSSTLSPAAPTSSKPQIELNQ
ncbi:unnamed protein product [Schistocephalus solidus]|uniref:Uncharacterized protein n=1 Tax=Schistocephalus solidus TaxID=70667 RepID=A0A183SSZ7_SCHSO|nr:unnamed protein product [Schistocephalus solidus]